jgi:hypothetical protein
MDNMRANLPRTSRDPVKHYMRRAAFGVVGKTGGMTVLLLRGPEKTPN